LPDSRIYSSCSTWQEIEGTVWGLIKAEWYLIKYLFKASPKLPIKFAPELKAKARFWLATPATREPDPRVYPKDAELY
jgi:hypothetical protein